MNHAEIRLSCVVSVPFDENCYIAHLEGNADCLVIDPGLEPEKIIKHLREEGLAPAAILITHGHCDHIAGCAALKDRWPECPLVIGEIEAPKLTDPRANLSAMMNMAVESPPADVTLCDGDSYSAAGFDLTVWDIPGHSGGHVVYCLKDRDPPLVFVGDVIFSGSIGRTDFPEGDFNQLKTGIHAKLFTLPDATVLLSGHGPETTVGREKQTNPFVGLQLE